jgi:hypothetical protein
LKRCEAQAAYLASGQDLLALESILMHQALVEAQGVLYRLVSEADDANWNDEVSTAVFTADHSLERGLGAGRLLAALSTPQSRQGEK